MEAYCYSVHWCPFKHPCHPPTLFGFTVCVCMQMSEWKKAGISSQAVQADLMQSDMLTAPPSPDPFGHWLREVRSTNTNRHTLYKELLHHRGGRWLIPTPTHLRVQLLSLILLNCFLIVSPRFGRFKGDTERLQAGGRR